MTPLAAIHSALVTRAETLAYPLVYPADGEDSPSGEYVEIRHIPNTTRRTALGAEPLHRMGIFQCTLCSPKGDHEIVYIEKAGVIADAFGLGRLPHVDGVAVKIERADIAQGFADGERWRVPVSIYYHTG